MSGPGVHASRLRPPMLGEATSGAFFAMMRRVRGQGPLWPLGGYLDIPSGFREW